MICVTDLSKQYGDTLALERLSLDVPQGAVFGLLGPNGAGKTTFLRLLMGFVLPNAGQLDRGGLRPAQIGYLPERAFYPSRFTIENYLLTMGRLIGLRGNNLRATVDHLLTQVDLWQISRRRLGACSRGMLQRLGLAQAMLGDPPLLLLDEPALGLDPTGQKFMREQIVTQHKAGKTVLLSSHHLDEVTRVCTHVAVLKRGQLVRSGPLETILAPRPQVLISTDPLPAGTRAHLAAMAPGIAVEEKQIVLSGDTVSCKNQILRHLLDAEVNIHQLSEQHASLEEVYLEATGG